MKTLQPRTLILAAVLTLGARLTVLAADSAPAATGESKDSQPLILDIGRFYNERFVTGTKTNASWQTVVGRRVFDGLPFQVDGRACVYGKKVSAFKPEFLGIQVGRKFDELHLLHVSQWADVEGQQIAFVRLNYTEGTKHEFPILFGGQVRDSHRMPSEEKELLADPNTKIVWRGAGAPRIKSTLRLFKTMLPNPHPEKEVITLNMVSTRHVAGYDLFAATAANRDSSRPVTPPAPAAEPERHFDGTLSVRVTDRATSQPIAGAVVDPNMQVDEVGVIAIPVSTSASGEAAIRYPVDRATRISVSVEKEGYGPGKASADFAAGETNRLEVELGPVPKIIGVVRDAAGVPISGAQLALWPEWRANAKETTTDANGRYLLIWNPRIDSGSDSAIQLVARDLKRNLALAQEVDEDTTNLDLALEPALTLAGRATDTDNKPLTNAEAHVIFWTERMGASFGKPERVDAQGRFEIKALPPGRRYGVTVSAKGYGQTSRTLEPETDNRRVELEPSQLAVANLRLAGVVKDADDKPLANASVNGHGEGQPSLHVQTDAKGRFSFSQVCAGPINLTAFSSGGGYGNTTAEGGDTNVVITLGVRESFASATGSSKITGIVLDADGKPAAKVRVSLFPSFMQTEKQTDAEGRFVLSFDPNQFRGMQENQRVVIARDPARNLAAAVDLDEEATNATLKLEPALALAGRVTDPGGKAITKGQAQAIFHTERMGSHMSSPSATDAEGRFEIKALPPGRRYGVTISAPGFGQEQRNVEAATESRRVDLEPFSLLVADQPLAGVVLDDNDKPVARASLFTYGEKQPNLNAQTDAQGRFSFAKVCAGRIQLSVNSPRGGFASLSAEGGDTNLTVHITSSSSGMVRAAPRAASLKGKPLPDLAPLGVAPADAAAGQMLLVALVDAEQRPSRRALRLVGEQGAALKQKNVAVIVLETGGMTDEAFAAWKKEAALPFPAARLKGEPEKARAAWGARALPWLILTDKAHKVTTEGFAPDELEAQLKTVIE